MMRIGWNSGKKKVDIGRLINWFGLRNSVIAREQSDRSNLVKNSVQNSLLCHPPT